MSEAKTVSKSVNKLVGTSIFQFFTRYAQDTPYLSTDELKETFVAAWEEVNDLDQPDNQFAFMDGVKSGCHMTKPGTVEHLMPMMTQIGKTYLEWWKLGCEYGNAEVQCWQIRRATGKATGQNPVWAKVRNRKTL